MDKFAVAGHSFLQDKTVHFITFQTEILRNPCASSFLLGGKTGGKRPGPRVQRARGARRRPAEAKAGSTPPLGFWLPRLPPPTFSLQVERLRATHRCPFSYSPCNQIRSHYIGPIASPCRRIRPQAVVIRGPCALPIPRLD